MKLIIQEKDNRLIYRRAKLDFNSKHPRRFMTTLQYWEMFGKANNMKVIIPEWQGPYPVVEALEFNDEAAYAWFLLRYS